MATENQLKKLEYIKKQITSANERGESPAKVLSKGLEGYEKAIKSVSQVGMWATIGPIVAIAAIVLRVFLIHFPRNNWVMSDQEIGTIIACIVACVISMVLGYKLWALNATPIFVLVSLLLILICNLVLFIGVVPVVTAILAIIALIRYSTFCSWFHSIKV